MSVNKILVVEDDSVDEMLTLRALKQCKVENEVEVIRDGGEAVDYLFANGKYSERDANELPALVILDLHLPTYDGMEILRRIRANEKTELLPVVMLTSSDDEKDKKESYKLGVNSFVRKPMQFSDFILAVTQLGRYWLVTSEPPS
jgi:CheY-like chemotaxis protein